jgi:small subunit ribosomal protein S21
MACVRPARTVSDPDAPSVRVTGDARATAFPAESLAWHFPAVSLYSPVRRESDIRISGLRRLDESPKEGCVVKLRLRENEYIADAVKRFRKLVEHAGIKKEMRRREYYEKPSEIKRRSRRRAERRARMQRLVAGGGSGA